MAFRRAIRIGAGVAIYGAIGALSLSIVDDALIYKKCTGKAMEVVLQDKRLASVLGDGIRIGPWYQASVGSALQGRAASCTFLVYGDHGSCAKLQLKAVREGGVTNSRSNLVYNTIGLGEWHLMFLDATIQDSESSQRIDLLAPYDAKCLPCQQQAQGQSIPVEAARSV